MFYRYEHYMSISHMVLIVDIVHMPYCDRCVGFKVSTYLMFIFIQMFFS